MSRNIQFIVIYIYVCVCVLLDLRSLILLCAICGCRTWWYLELEERLDDSYGAVASFVL